MERSLELIQQFKQQALRGLLPASLFLASILGSPGEGNASKNLLPDTASFTVPPNTIGEQTTAVLLVKSNLLDTEPTTRDAVRQKVFGENGNTVNNYIKESSFGKTWLRGDVFGWYKILMETTCDITSFADQARAEAAREVNLSLYRRTVFVFNGAVCTDRGNGRQNISWIFDHTNIRWFHHEIGHNFGILAHAGLLYCQNLSDCTNPDYGDKWSVMGLSGYDDTAPIFQLNGPHKAALGWIPQTNIREVTSNGVYDIRNIEEATREIQLLKIKIPGTEDYYYASFRKAAGFFDSNLPPAFTSGASLHKWNENPASNTLFIDTNPQTRRDFSDAPLSDGRTFTDPTNGIEITQITHTADNVTLNVSSRALRPPLSATLSGPDTWGANQPLNLSAGFESTSGNLTAGLILLARTDGSPVDNCQTPLGSLCRVFLDTFTGTSRTYSLNLSLNRGDYLIFANAFDSNGTKCSAAYQLLGQNWLDCGANDALRLNIR